MGLNESQRRAVALTLRQLEERLDEIEYLLDRSDDRILRQRRPPQLAHDERERVDGLIAEMRRSIGEIAATYGFEPQTIDSRQTVAAIAGLAWESLGEITSKRLRAYGEVNADVQIDLDPPVEQLMADLLALQALVVPPSAPPTTAARPRTHPNR